MIRRVAAIKIPKEIIVVDDGSTVGTQLILKKLAEVASRRGHSAPCSSAERQAASQLRVILQERNRGKGAAVRRGLAEASGDVLLVQDADLEYDPQDYFALLAPIERGAADVV
jgi:glycosyltransferase involved in cell wall biosynthesis